MSAEEVVREFCAVVSKRDEALLRPLLDDGIVYHNIGMPASRGIEEAVANLAGQWAMFPERYEYELRNLAVAGDTVLTERIDHIGMAGLLAPVPVMGTFVVRDERIVEWRDYFDPTLVAKQLGGEATTDLIS
jgi:limonene-1,2-epoxide hydrolase